MISIEKEEKERKVKKKSKIPYEHSKNHYKYYDEYYIISLRHKRQR